jgi:hypothetical protein
MVVKKTATPKKNKEKENGSASGGIDQDKVSQTVNLDNKQAQQFIDFYVDIEDPTEKNLYRFFKRKTSDNYYYTCHGRNAVDVARDYFKTLAALRFWAGNRPQDYPKKDEKRQRYPNLHSF